jgi:OOP family OmpA-OmpF porin
MRVSKSVLAAALLGMVTVAGQCESVAEPGPYIGAGLGYSVADIEQQKIEEGVCGGTCDTYSDDENDWGFKVFGGYLINENFAIEAGYFNVGKFTYHAADALDSMNGEYKMHGANLDVLFHLPVSDNVSLMARGGVLYAQVKEEYNGVDGAVLFPGDATGGKYDKSDVGFKYGVGVQLDLSPAWGFRGEWENYHVEEALSAGADLSLFSLGLVYRFGIEEEPPPPPPEPVVIEKIVEKPVVVEKEVVKEVEVPAEPVVVVTPAPPAERVILASDALFDFDKSVVKPQGRASLRELAKKLEKDDRLVITGHTDSVGSELYNLRLSQRRATAVMNYLVQLGIPEARMETRAKGESEPVADNATDEGRAANRRVEIDIIAAPKTAE